MRATFLCCKQLLQLSKIWIRKGYLVKKCTFSPLISHKGRRTKITCDTKWTYMDSLLYCTYPMASSTCWSCHVLSIFFHCNMMQNATKELPVEVRAQIIGKTDFSLWQKSIFFFWHAKFWKIIWASPCKNVSSSTCEQQKLIAVRKHNHWILKKIWMESKGTDDTERILRIFEGSFY